MSFPTLTPESSASAVVLPPTGTHADVAATLPYGIYSTTAMGGSDYDFISGAVDQVAYTYKRLGGDVLDIEVTAGNVYANYEAAVLEYSYLVNLHQSKNALGSALGSLTSSFDHKGDVSGSGTQAALKYPKMRFSLLSF